MSGKNKTKLVPKKGKCKPQGHNTGKEEVGGPELIILGKFLYNGAYFSHSGYFSF